MAIRHKPKKSKNDIPSALVPILLFLLFLSFLGEVLFYLIIGVIFACVILGTIWGIIKLVKQLKNRHNKIKPEIASPPVTLKPDPPSFSPIIGGEGVSQSSYDLAISQHSEFPRYYNIDGIKYDIDNPEDIRKIPLITNILTINGKEYGMDTILYEHYRQCSDRSLGYTAYDKCQEFRSHGIIHKSDWELELEKRYEIRKAKEDVRKQQCDTFTVDDMQQFPDIPIAWSYIMQLQHTNGIAWCQLNWNNQKIVLQYLSQINDIIDAQSYVEGIGDSHIDLDSMDFDYPVPMYMNSMCNTRIECYPYTATGKLSKYPVLIPFATKPDSSGLRAVGEIKILRDGNIGAATVHVNGNTFKIGLHGASLVLKRVDNPYMGGNLFKFSEYYE